MLGTRLDMSTADHRQTGGQTERVNRVIEYILRSVCAQTPKRWSSKLPVVEFALNNVVHASTGYTMFYVIGLSHLRVPLTILLRGSGLGERLVNKPIGLVKVNKTIGLLISDLLPFKNK